MLRELISRSEYLELLRRRRNALNAICRNKNWKSVRASIKKISKFYNHPQCLEVVEGCISTPVDNFSSEINNLVLDTARRLRPWRIGPFNLCGNLIDAEWRSQQKWARISTLLKLPADSTILDVGCSNGYFMARMLEFNPQLIVGFDPIDRCYLQFKLLNAILKSSTLHFEPLGLQDLDVLPNCFDLTLCMGVIYHQRDPQSALKYLFNTLKPGGKLILESLVVPGEKTLSLTAPERYAKMRNTWHVPSVPDLKEWLREAGFTEIQSLEPVTISTTEQRRTEWAPYESLAEFLDPNDSSLTIEGHPAPTSCIFTADRSASRQPIIPQC